MKKRILVFIGLTLLVIGLVFEPLKSLMGSAARGEYYSHIILIPLVSAYLIWQKRKEIFLTPGPIYPLGLALAVCGAVIYGLGLTLGKGFNQNDQTALLTFSAILIWAGGFLSLFGAQAIKKASFAILFLVFMIPIPSAILDKIIYALQVWSTEAAEILFAVSGVPYNRQGFVFQLPGISVEVAEVCSGIRSSLALFITSILAGHFFLDKFWKKVILALIVFPVTVFKNGIRIVTLSLLGAYVDVRFLTDSFLHRSGGFVFFIPALVLLGVALWWLRKTGNRAPRRT